MFTRGEHFVGIITYRFDDAFTFILDMDASKDKSKNGLAALIILCFSHGDLSEMCSVRTMSVGMYMRFRFPKPINLDIGAFRYELNLELPGVDVPGMNSSVLVPQHLSVDKKYDIVCDSVLTDCLKWSLSFLKTPGEKIQFECDEIIINEN